MAIPLHKDISNPQAIHDSMINDKYVYRWFSYLIIQPGIQDRIQPNEQWQKEFTNYKKCEVVQTVICFLLILTIIGDGMRYSLVTVAVAIVLFYIYMQILVQKKINVSNIGSGLIEEDFKAEEIGKKTLYQLGEMYSKKYNVPSMVDALSAQELLSRKVALGIIFLVFFIFPGWMKWEGIVLAYVMYFIITNALFLSFFYKKF